MTGQSASASLKSQPTLELPHSVYGLDPSSALASGPAAVHGPRGLERLEQLGQSSGNIEASERSGAPLEPIEIQLQSALKLPLSPKP